MQTFCISIICAIRLQHGAKCRRCCLMECEDRNRYFKKTLGILKEGAAADVIVVDYDPLTPMDASNCNGHLLFGVNGSMVQTTVCNGKVLMKDREVLVCDEEKSYGRLSSGCKRTCR